MRFLSSQDGSIVPAAASAFLMLTVVGFSAIEYARASGMQAGLQHSLDSALLAAGRADVDTDAERSVVAQRYVEANLGARYTSIRINVAVHADHDNVLTGTASANVPATFGAIVGVERIPIKAYAEIQAAVEKELELALVLDSTGSMDGSRLNTLKQAARELTETIMDGRQVKVSVVPFAEYVNVGMAHRNHPGIDVPRDEAGTRRCEMRDQREYYNCRTVQSTCTNDGRSYPCTRNQCDSRVVGQRESCWTEGRKEWKGCIGSRDDGTRGYDEDAEREDDDDEEVDEEDGDDEGRGRGNAYGRNRNGAPNSGIDLARTNEYPGLMNQSCNSPLTRLTLEKRAVQSAISSLSARGETYVPAGLIGGWNTLSPDYPFPDGSNPETADHDIMKVMILMTDGANTKSQSSGSPWHSARRVADANALTLEICSNIKASGIELYTIAFEVSDRATETMLQTCASEGNYYYDARNALQLNEAFSDIASQLTVLQLTR